MGLATGLIDITLLIVSGNFLKALALWGGFMIQSPVAVLKCQPKYSCMPGCSECGFPVNPFGTVWLHPMKWLYAMILSPYLLLIPIMKSLPTVIIWILVCVKGCTACVNCVPCKAFWECVKWTFCKCGPCVSVWNGIKWCFCCGPCIGFWLFCLKPCIFCFVSTFGAFFTLFIWKYARESFLYWSWKLFHLDLMWPVIALALLQIWAMVMPLIATSLYSTLICATKEEAASAKSEVNPMAGIMSMGMNPMMGQQQNQDPEAMMKLMQMQMQQGQSGGGPGMGGMGAQASPLGGLISIRSLFMLPVPLAICEETRVTLYKLDVEAARDDFHQPQHDEEGGEGGCPQQ